MKLREKIWRLFLIVLESFESHAEQITIIPNLNNFYQWIVRKTTNFVKEPGRDFKMSKKVFDGAEVLREKEISKIDSNKHMDDNEVLIL